VPVLDSEKRLTVVPDGVVVAPEAARCLERASDALARGLTVSAWRWAAHAVAVLDELIGDEGGQGQVAEKTREIHTGS
jgi:hypothetical protein